MKYNIVVNKKTGEKLPFKNMVELDYSIAKIDTRLALLFEQKESVFKIFEKYEEDETSIYLVENKILISFNREDFYYILYEVPFDVVDFIKVNKVINFVFNHNNLDYLFKFDKIIQ